MEVRAAYVITCHSSRRTFRSGRGRWEFKVGWGSEGEEEDEKEEEEEEEEEEEKEGVEMNGEEEGWEQ
ncbi:hypothetical protein SprV_0602158400 [Sparganum proliferum]